MPTARSGIAASVLGAGGPKPGATASTVVEMLAP